MYLEKTFSNCPDRRLGETREDIQTTGKVRKLRFFFSGRFEVLVGGWTAREWPGVVVGVGQEPGGGACALGPERTRQRPWPAPSVCPLRRQHQVPRLYPEGTAQCHLPGLLTNQMTSLPNSRPLTSPCNSLVILIWWHSYSLSLTWPHSYGHILPNFSL